MTCNCALFVHNLYNKECKKIDSNHLVQNNNIGHANGTSRIFC